MASRANQDNTRAFIFLGGSQGMSLKVGTRWDGRGAKVGSELQKIKSYINKAKDQNLHQQDRSKMILADVSQNQSDISLMCLIKPSHLLSAEQQLPSSVQLQLQLSWGLSLALVSASTPTHPTAEKVGKEHQRKCLLLAGICYLLLVPCLYAT